MRVLSGDYLPREAPPAPRRRDPLAESLVQEAARSDDAIKRLAAVERLRGDLDSLMVVAIKSRHRDSAEAARAAYLESLDERNAAIVRRCVAIYCDVPERRERAVLALGAYPDELAAVAGESRYQDTRAMARSMLAR